MVIYRVILTSKFRERKSLIQPQLVRFSYHLANFIEIFGKQMSKSLTNLAKNHPCYYLYSNNRKSVCVANLSVIFVSASEADEQVHQ